MDRFGNVFHSMASNEEPDSDEEYERACEEEDAKMEEWVKSRDFEKHEAEWRASKVRERIAAEQDLYFRHLDCDLNRQKYMRQHERGDDTESVQFDPRPYDELDVLESEYFEQVNVAESSLKVPQGMHEFFMELFEVALDSGSGEHVVDGSTVPAYKVEESPGSRAGQHFITANNAKIRNQGQVVLKLRNGPPTRKGGHTIRSTFQVARVSRPLWSVSKICDEGFEVRFTKTHATIITPQGREICRFERKGGLYVAQLHLKNPDFEHFARRGQDA
jgi:hypothetical protein